MRGRCDCLKALPVYNHHCGYYNLDLGYSASFSQNSPCQPLKTENDFQATWVVSIGWWFRLLQRLA
jgi:hypothetical protein